MRLLFCQSRLKLIAVVLTGLFLAFSFYSFFYLLRELFRILTITDQYDIWILSERQVYTYNLISAFIALVFAQSFVLAFLFDRPQRPFKKHNFKRNSIVNDQRLLNCYFLFWLFKMIIVFGSIISFFGPATFYVLIAEFDLWILFILVILVLFLQTWNTIRLAYTKHSAKWMLLSFLCITLLALGMATINIIDYKAINQKVLSKNVFINYKMVLPQSDNYTLDRSVLDIYIAASKSGDNKEEPIIIINNKEVNLGEIEEVFLDLYKDNTWMIPHNIYRLYVHNEVKELFLKKVKYALSKAGIRRITYGITPVAMEYDPRYYSTNYSFNTIIPRFAEIDTIQGLGTADNKSRIIIHGKNTAYKVNGILVESTEIENVFTSALIANTNAIFMYKLDSNTSFGEYFIAYKAAQKAVENLREVYSQQAFSRKFDELKIEQALEVARKYPFKFVEV